MEAVVETEYGSKALGAVVQIHLLRRMLLPSCHHPLLETQYLSNQLVQKTPGTPVRCEWFVTCSENWWLVRTRLS